jgi:hypothetical protein
VGDQVIEQVVNASRALVAAGLSDMVNHGQRQAGWQYLLRSAGRMLPP